MNDANFDIDVNANASIDGSVDVNQSLDIDLDNVQSLDATFTNDTELDATLSADQTLSVSLSVGYNIDDCKVLYNTCEFWNSKPSLIGQAGYLYIYSDYDVENNLVAIKVGDGNAYLKDLPFLDKLYAEHIANMDIHITSEEREFWNNKMRCYIDGTRIIFTKEKEE